MKRRRQGDKERQMKGYVMRMMVLLLLLLMLLLLMLVLLVVLLLMMFHRWRFPFPISSRCFCVFCKGSSSQPHYLCPEGVEIASRAFQRQQCSISAIVFDILAIGVGVLITSFAIATHNSKISIPLVMGNKNKRDQAHIMNIF